MEARLLSTVLSLLAVLLAGWALEDLDPRKVLFPCGQAHAGLVGSWWGPGGAGTENVQPRQVPLTFPPTPDQLLNIYPLAPPGPHLRHRGSKVSRLLTALGGWLCLQPGPLVHEGSQGWGLAGLLLFPG